MHTTGGRFNTDNQNGTNHYSTVAVALPLFPLYFGIFALARVECPCLSFVVDYSSLFGTHVIFVQRKHDEVAFVPKYWKIESSLRNLENIKILFHYDEFFYLYPAQIPKILLTGPARYLTKGYKREDDEKFF